MGRVRVTVPPGVVAGQQIQVQTPAGLVAVVVPPGVQTGGQFDIEVPDQQGGAAPPPAPAPEPAATPKPPQEILVNVPRGTNAGELFNFTTPDGGTVVLKCPQPYPHQGKFKFMWTPGMGGGSDKGAREYSSQPIQVAVPRGVNAGGKFNFQLPDGRMVENISVRLDKTPEGFGLGLSNDNIVTLLAPGGQAANCGQLMVGDKVTGVNGTFLSASTTLSSIVGPLPIGSRIVLNIQRPQGGGAPPPSMQQQPSSMMMPPTPAPAAAPQPQKMRVQIPPGVMGGQVIQVQTPTGQMMQVQVPPGMTPGQQFEMALPDLGQQVPPAQPQMPTPMAGPGMAAAPAYPGMGGGAPPPMVQGYGGGAPDPYGAPPAYPGGGSAYPSMGGSQAPAPAYPPTSAPGYPPQAPAPGLAESSMYPPAYPQAAPGYPQAAPGYPQAAPAYPQAAPAYPGGGGYPPGA